MKNAIKLFSVIVIASHIIACQKDIKLKLLKYDSQLSIECILYPGKVPQLFLSTSVPFFSSSVSPSQLFARGAIVSITGTSTDNLVADSVFDKFRCRWVTFYKGTIPAQQGQSYNLSVTYKGTTYSATTTINQPKVTIASTSFVHSFHDIYGDHEGVILNFNDIAGSDNSYRYQMNRMIDSSVYGASNLGLIHSTCTNGAMFYTSEFGRSIYFDKGLDGQGMQFVIEPAFKHKMNDTAYVFVQSLDKNSAEFYDNIDKQKLAQLNPFVEPVFLKTKIEGCIGVFGSAVVSDSVLFVYPE
ncbi:MAG: hypothetical protein JWO44_216 [Bacteroidetes bacterium]|nr:hypothetical protein [Bacteroidota bacterium]